MEKKNVNEFLPFTKEELKELNFTPEELEVIMSAEAATQTLDLLPENPDQLLDKIDKEFPKGQDPNETLTKLAKLAETNPQLYAQVLSLTELTGSCAEVKPEK